MKIKHICIAALSQYKLPSLWHLPCRGLRDAPVKLAISNGQHKFGRWRVKGSLCEAVAVQSFPEHSDGQG